MTKVMAAGEERKGLIWELLVESELVTHWRWWVRSRMTQRFLFCRNGCMMVPFTRKQNLGKGTSVGGRE
jgi:hypothetical protein